MIAEYLQGMATLRKHTNSGTPDNWKFSCMEEAVLVEGQPFIGGNIEYWERQEILAALNEVKRSNPSLGKAKQCFSNAFLLAANSNDFQYVEGYAHGLIPFHHAWNLWRGKILVDTTLRTGEIITPEGKVKPRKRNWGDAIIGGIPEKYEFYGVVFNPKEFAAAAVVTRQQGGFLDCWERNFPFLREGMDAFRLERNRV